MYLVIFEISIEFIFICQFYPKNLDFEGGDNADFLISNEEFFFRLMGH